MPFIRSKSAPDLVERDGTRERLATGDAVNVAARLEQAAQPGEVLIGEPTLELVRGAADVEEVAPLRLKGKAAPVPA
jgi:class 3 adenylate cyclase